MSTTYKQLYQKVLLRVPRLDGRALLAAKESVNDAQRVIARIHDFDELKVLDTTSADTVDGQKAYHITTDLLLTRPKDIYSIIIEDTTNSRKLIYKDPREMDLDEPYPEGTTEQRPTHYTRRGQYIYLNPIPDAAYDMHIFYAQWPLVLSADTDAMSFDDERVDFIVALAAEMTMAILDGKPSSDWTKRAKEMLFGAVTENKVNPDAQYVAKPFDPCGMGTLYQGEYWTNPFIKGVR